MRIRAAILGGRGYGGMELSRLLLQHPDVELTAVTSRSEEGRVEALHPHLTGFTDLAFTRESPEVLREIAASSDVLFLARPHGVSAREAHDLLEAAPQVTAIDLAGDHRLRDAALYPAWYGFEHPHPDVLAHVVYGLPECGGRQDLVRAAGASGARLVANPGCHATAALLALWPLARAGLLAGPAAVTSVTGSSGSGAGPRPGAHHPTRFANFRAYRPLRHQHLPEIVQALDGARVDLVPCSAPMARGIYATALAPVPAGREDEVEPAFRGRYEGEPFVRLRAAPPELRHVVGTNFADLSVVVWEGVACVTVAIDNLGKGMAGTAVQNLNILFGLEETAGLWRPGPGL
ncbi:MAG: N-acetyl-gamma-glutamyl-phosphate reductase [Planctomycetota bacterium]